MKNKDIDQDKATTEDCESFKKTLEMLREKKASLIQKRDSLLLAYENVDLSVQKEENKKETQTKKVEEMQNKVIALPSLEENIYAQELKDKYQKVLIDLRELKSLILDKVEEKKEKIDSIYCPNSKRSFKRSLNYIHLSLLDELSELVSQCVPAKILQDKEKQIQLCENLLQF